MAKPKYRVRVDWNHGGLGDQDTAMDFSTAIDDITSDVRVMGYDHVRDLSSELIESGILSLELNNTDHKYSPTNITGGSASPLIASGATLVLPGKPIWVQMFYPYDAFTGSQANLDTHTPDEDSAWAWVDSTYEFELDGSGNARIANSTSDSQTAGPRYSYMEYGDKNASLHARITTPSAYLVSFANNRASYFGFLIRWTDANNYQAVGFDVSNSTRRGRVSLFTYSTNRTVTGNGSSSTNNYTCPDSSLYTVDQYVMIEHELHRITAIPNSTTITCNRGQLSTQATAHTGTLAAPIVQMSRLTVRTSSTVGAGSALWSVSETHDIQVHLRDEYIDVTFDGSHCSPGDSGDVFSVGSKTFAVAEGVEPVTSHTFVAEAGASVGTKHGLWRQDRAKRGSDYGDTPAESSLDAVELYEEFGGYRSLFFGYLSSITPDPDPQNQYCYIEAYDEFETAKRAHIRYSVVSGDAWGVRRKELHTPLLELMGHAKQFVYGWTAFTNYRAHNLIMEPFTAVAGPAADIEVDGQPANKKIDDNLLNVLWQAQVEEDGFIYMDGEGFLRLESRVHRTGAGTGHTPNTWPIITPSGQAHSATHDSLTSHTHVLYGRDAAATYKNTYDGTNPAYSFLSYEDGHQNIENRLTMVVQGAVIAVVYATKIWNSSQADGDERIEVGAGATITIICDLGSSYTTASAVQTPSVTNTYLAAYPARDASGTAATNSEIVATAVRALGDPNYSAFKFTLANTTGSTLYVTKFDLYTPTSSPGGSHVGAYKLGEKVAVESLDATSITAYGERRKELKSLFLTNSETAQLALANRLARKKDPKTVMTLTLLGGDKATLHHMITRRLSDRVKVTNSDLNMTDKEMYVEGETWDISEGGTVIEQQLLLRAV